MARKAKTENSTSESEQQASETNLLALTTDIVASYLRHNQVPSSELPMVIRKIFGSLSEMAGGAGVAAADTPEPAVPVKKSINDDFIICLEDGKKLRTLKRYLKTHYNLSPEAYRARWQLPREYPMVAPSYARLRSAFAKKIGLGRVPAGRPRRAKTAG
jgi:predicted transcriptional regulator